ncbi:VAM7 [Ceraceosorus bombacis]|uniref:VAM7 n=1 Tax=Ceraceosorus bombacis TaxID=401625 RepID=A0A0P1BP99_9BASI|nr:VAM7 [Ceraceosorus bombacis]
MMAPIQSITLPSSETRTSPSPKHTVYALRVALPVRSWTVWRRYSEFLALHTTLCSLGNPPAAFPPKHAARNTIRAIGSLGGLLSREAAVARTNKPAEDEDTRERRAGLERYMRAILSCADSRWRQAPEFAAFIELAPSDKRALSVATPASSSQDASGSGPPVLERITAPRQPYVPGSYAGQAPNRSLQGATSRTLGAPPPPVETHQTRALDDEGLVKLQQGQMDSQDARLGDLAAVLRRQRQMGLAINQELQEQTEMLRGLGEEVDQVESKMTGAEKQMDRL